MVGGEIFPPPNNIGGSVEPNRIGLISQEQDFKFGSRNKIEDRVFIKKKKKKKRMHENCRRFSELGEILH